MKEIKRNSLQAWILAARPKTLTGAVTPVLIGTALAAMDGHFEWLPAMTFLTSSKGRTGKTAWGLNAPVRKVGFLFRQ